MVPVYYASPLTQADMQNDVASGKLFAAYISGDVPTGRFNYFSSRIISAQGMFTLNTPMLLGVINAAVSQALSAGVPQNIIQGAKYAGKPLSEIHTCSTAQGAAPAEAWPTVAALDAANEPWWVNGEIKIGTPYTSFGWFYNFITPPYSGFYSDYFDAVNAIIISRYQPAVSKFKGMTRVVDTTKTTSAAVLKTLATQDGTIDASDMWFFYDVTYTGLIPPASPPTYTVTTTSGSNVVTVPSSNDISRITVGSVVSVTDSSSTSLVATVTAVSDNSVTLSAAPSSASSSATLTVTSIYYSGVGRNVVFQPTCAFFGGDGSFFTQVALNTDAPVLSQGATAGIAIGCVAFVLVSIFTCVVIHRERSGTPMFMRLIDQDERSKDVGWKGSEEEGYATPEGSMPPPPPGPAGMQLAMTGVEGRSR